MSSGSTRRRLARATLINLEGYDVMPCSYCSSQRPPLQCRMREGNTVCGECTRRGRPCDGNGVSLSEADRLVQAKRRIEVEEEATEEELLDLQRQMNERLSRLMRLRRQKRQIQTKGTKMLERGLQSMDELEAVEQQEAQAVVDARSAGAANIVDWTAILGASWSDPAGESSSEVVRRS
ncbi:hypothetical protein FNYG_14371 [Fusarium nygamai]|uniref:Uncharacterized protein n=1 Tax=Gibberella nygamai TaxID=42673 RepID=A0A2K0USY3_GIBNY|nr:hypothetical protein FNYG_14371 [Fusarium nygamai]